MFFFLSFLSQFRSLKCEDGIDFFVQNISKYLEIRKKMFYRPTKRGRRTGFSLGLDSQRGPSLWLVEAIQKDLPII